MEAQPTWKDADKGFSPTNIISQEKLGPGVTGKKSWSSTPKRYVSSRQVGARAGSRGSGGKVKELSPWADFNLGAGRKNDAHVRICATAGPRSSTDAKTEDGKATRWSRSRRDGGQAAPTWRRIAALVGFPGCGLSLGLARRKEFKADETAKVADLDVSRKSTGPKEHAPR